METFKAILQAKCPKCREGDMFEHSAYNPKGFQKMHESCPICGLRFEREPGFFIGAMYVNYAFTVAIIVAVAIALNIFDLYNLTNFLIGILSATVLLLPILFRYSRVLYLYLFGAVKYDPNTANK